MEGWKIGPPSFHSSILPTTKSVKKFLKHALCSMKTQTLCNAYHRSIGLSGAACCLAPTAQDIRCHKGTHRLGISLTSKFFLRPNSRSFPSRLRIFPDGCDRDDAAVRHNGTILIALLMPIIPLRSRRGCLSLDFKDSLDQMKVSVLVEPSDHIVRDRFECFLSTHKFYRWLLTHKGPLNSIQIMFYAWQRPRFA